jgi:hypothetical protein
MQPFDTTAYTLKRYPDNRITRLFPDGHEEEELTQDFYQYQIGFHDQVLANLRAQLDKVVAFELENPPFEIEEPEAR